MQQIESVKVTEKFVQVLYKEHVGDQVNEYALKCKDAPHPDLVAALQALRPYVVDVLEERSELANGIWVLKVGWTWKENKDSGEWEPKVTMHAIKALARSTSPWNIHTPVVKPDAEFGEALDAVEEEALAYVGGKRA